MTTTRLPPHDPGYQRDLGDGLVLRWSTPADVEPIARLYEHVFRDREDDPPEQLVVAWTRDMLSGQHPLVTPGDGVLVEHLPTGRVVAATVVMQQVWRYGGITLPVGRPEVVGTHPDFRRRGLIRAIFDLFHARSEARGDLVQAITGIRYFYRQFGYEYALDLEGGRVVQLSDIPSLKEGQVEPCRLRDATGDDIPLLQTLYERERAGMLVSAHIDAIYWRYVMHGMSAGSLEGWRVQMVADAEGRALGYVLTRRGRRDGIVVHGLSVAAGVSLVAVMPSLMRALREQAPLLPPYRPDAPPPTKARFALGSQHPAYAALGRLAPPGGPPYAWYVRVPDPPRFIQHIAPALEARLADSILAGHSGELRMDFFTSGLRLVFEAGRLTTAEPWRPPEWEPAAQCGYPPLVFLHQLFGHHSRAELRAIYPDVWASDEALPLVETLFPKQHSNVWSLE